MANGHQPKVTLTLFAKSISVGDFAEQVKSGFTCDYLSNLIVGEGYSGLDDPYEFARWDRRLETCQVGRKVAGVLGIFLGNCFDNIRGAFVRGSLHSILDLKLDNWFVDAVRNSKGANQVDVGSQLFSAVSLIISRVAEAAFALIVIALV